MQLLDHIPVDFYNFILVTVFSLLIGLEQRRHHFDDKPGSLYGTDRTYTFVGILGFILYLISPQGFLPFLLAGAENTPKKRKLGIFLPTAVFTPAMPSTGDCMEPLPRILPLCQLMSTCERTARRPA